MTEFRFFSHRNSSFIDLRSHLNGKCLQAHDVCLQSEPCLDIFFVDVKSTFSGKVGVISMIEEYLSIFLSITCSICR